MKKIAIAIDDYKLNTFQEILTDNGFRFDILDGLIEKVIILRVYVNGCDVGKLSSLTDFANEVAKHG